MKETTRSNMLAVAAAFNMLVAGFIVLFPSPNQEPSPQEVLQAYIIALVVALFGVGYYWASRDFQNHANMVRLGMAGKLGVASLCFSHALRGKIPWKDTLMSVPDVGFAVLFYLALEKETDNTKKKQS